MGCGGKPKYKNNITMVQNKEKQSNIDVLDMNEAASLLNISKMYLYKLVQHREITYYKGKGGKKTYFKREDVLSYMLHTRMPSNEELRQEAAAYNVRQSGRRI